LPILTGEALLVGARIRSTTTSKTDKALDIRKIFYSIFSIFVSLLLELISKIRLGHQSKARSDEKAESRHRRDEHFEAIRNTAMGT
jgi:hypothetical protein